MTTNTPPPGVPPVLSWGSQFMKDVGFPICIALILLWATVIRFPAVLESLTDRLTATMRESSAEQTHKIQILIEEVKRSK